MFTGIVRAVGRLIEWQPLAGGKTLVVDPLSLRSAPPPLGGSLAVNGVCLSVHRRSAQHWVFDLSSETLSCTALGNLAVGSAINLEPPLTLADPLGGHLVLGHVDGVGRLLDNTADGACRRLRFSFPAALAPYLAVKGCICVHGVSLTINALAEETSDFSVCLIPHTLEQSNLIDLQPGQAVNLEVDLLARYLQRLVTARGR